MTALKRAVRRWTLPLVAPLTRKADRAAAVQGRDPHAPPHTRIQRLHRDLRPAQHDYRVERLERNSLTTLR